MITLTHGTDTTASRNFFIEEKLKYTEKTTLEATTKDLTDIMQALSGGGLFDKTQTLFLEGFITEKKSSKEIIAIAAYLNQEQTNSIFLWEPKELTAKELKLFPQATIKAFSIPKTVFLFLENVLPQNSTKLLQLYHQILTHDDAHYVLFMLSRQIRILLALKSEGNEQISEVKRLAPWQAGKLKKQSLAFSQEQLILLHKKLFQLDLNQKTGGLILPLEKELDFLLITL
jgi:hypothetical protein